MVKAAALLLNVVTVGLAGCGGSGAATTSVHRPLPHPVPSTVAALAALPGGGLRVGELQTGVIRDLDGASIARVAVSTGGQRGLLGLAVSPPGATYAAYTDPSRRIVVARVDTRVPRLVWRGPPSADLANGGHLVWAPDGRLVIGIGDLQHPSLIRDPQAVNGKLLALDPNGPADQHPVVLSAGWNNPFAFTFTPDGQLWVADNSPGTRPERLARGDRRDGPVSDLPVKTAPSGLAALDDHTLAVCGVVSGRLDRYRIDAAGRARFAGTIARCTFGVVRLSAGTLVVSTPTGLHRVRP